jgi:hypothetical protein
MMTHDLAGKQQIDSTNHLKSIFEQSLAELREDKNHKSNNVRTNNDKNNNNNDDKNLVKKTRPQVRVRRDFLPLHIDHANLQKRALDEAAKALAALWKISGPGHAKLSGRVLVSHK